MAMKQAANRPAPGDHSSFVSRYVEMAVSPLQHDHTEMQSLCYTVPTIPKHQ